MKIDELTAIVRQSRYIVVLCGSDMLEESGTLPLRHQNRAYEIEEKYGHSPEDFLSQAFYSTRPEQFYNFYRQELLTDAKKPGEVFRLLARFQNLAPVRSIITNDFLDFPRRSGCRNVIELHGNINHNTCDKCGAVFSSSYILNSRRCPVCDKCGGPVRPGIIFIGDMVSNRLMTKAAMEITYADTLILLGCTMNSDLAVRYIKYFEGNRLILMNSRPHYLDSKADFTVHAPITAILESLNRHLDAKSISGRSL